MDETTTHHPGSYLVDHLSHQENIHFVFLEKKIIVVNINYTLHRTRAVEVNLTPQPLKVIVVFLKKASSLFKLRHTTSKIIDLRHVTTIKVSGSNGITDLAVGNRMKFPIK